MTYRVAQILEGLNFCKLQFLENNFVNSLSKPRTRHTCNALWAWHTSLCSIKHTVTHNCPLEFAAVSKQCLLRRYFFEDRSLRIGQLSLRMLSIDALSVSMVHVLKIVIEIISQMFVKLKRYMVTNTLVHSKKGYQCTQFGVIKSLSP